jgi:hypothetical protein
MPLPFVKILYFMYSYLELRLFCVGLLTCLYVCWESSRLLCLACHVCLLWIEIIFVRIEIFVLIFVELLAVFLIVKSNGYPIPTKNPMDMGMGINFYPRIRVWISICDLFIDGWVIALPDLNLTRYHPYHKANKTMYKKIDHKLIQAEVLLRS